MTNVVIYCLRLYQKYISPILVSTLGHSCRYSPTCSEYSIQAFNKYGIVKGGYLSTVRILSCNPFSKRVSYPLE